MGKEEFEYHLIEASKFLKEFTSSMVKNSISNNFLYKIAFTSEDNSYLNNDEKQKFKFIQKYKGVYLSQGEVVVLLSMNDLVPMYINMSIIKSTKRKTYVELLCSKRYVEKEELNFKADEFPPFHPLVPTPIFYEGKEKFDINFKYHFLQKMFFKYF